VNATELIEVLSAAIAAYTEIRADLQSGVITAADAEAKIAVHHAALVSARAAEDAEIAAKATP